MNINSQIAEQFYNYINTDINGNICPENKLFSNIHTEIALLATIFRKGRDIFTKLAPSGNFDFGRELFTNPKCRIFFDVLESLYTESKLEFTEPHIYEELQRFNLQSEVSSTTIYALGDALCRPEHAENYIHELQKLSDYRKIHQLTEDLRVELSSSKNLESVKAFAHKRLDSIGKSFESTVGKAGDICSKLFQFNHEEKSYKFHSPYPPISTGFEDLDVYYNGGLRGAETLVIAGRPGSGKTGLMICLAANMALAGIPVYISSMEMTRPQLVSRLITAISEIPSAIIKNNFADYDKVCQVYEIIMNLPIYIDDEAYVEIDILKARIKSLEDREGIKIGAHFSDYIQLYKLDPKKNKTEGLEDLMIDISNLAKELGIPEIALSQLSRECDNRADKKPTLADLRSSGGIEQTANSVIGIYRDEYYNPNTVDKKVAELIILKNREGPVGTIKMFFDAMIVKFKNMVKS